MFAVRAYRRAAGFAVDGTFYPSDTWTLMNSVPDAVSAAAQPSAPGEIAELQVIEVKGAKDPALAPYGTQKTSDAQPAPDLPPAAQGPLDASNTQPDAAALARSTEAASLPGPSTDGGPTK